jgi:hypothetical protein
MSNTQRQLNLANHGLLTTAMLGAKAFTNCAPCLILKHLSNEEIFDLRGELIAIEQTAAKVRENLDDHLTTEVFPRIR